MPAYMTKSQLVAKIAELQETAKKDVSGMIDALAEVGYKELKKNGVFVVPGFAKFVHRRRDDVQGQARAQDRSRPPGQGRQDGGVRFHRSEDEGPRKGPFVFLMLSLCETY
jgi:nucleoid DNA-binding protein